LRGSGSSLDSITGQVTAPEKKPGPLEGITAYNLPTQEVESRDDLLRRRRITYIQEKVARGAEYSDFGKHASQLKINPELFSSADNNENAKRLLQSQLTLAKRGYSPQEAKALEKRGADFSGKPQQKAESAALFESAKALNQAAETIKQTASPAQSGDGKPQGLRIFDENTQQVLKEFRNAIDSMAKVAEQKDKQKEEQKAGQRSDSANVALGETLNQFGQVFDSSVSVFGQHTTTLSNSINQFGSYAETFGNHVSSFGEFVAAIPTTIELNGKTEVTVTVEGLGHLNELEGKMKEVATEISGKMVDELRNRVRDQGFGMG